MKATLPSEKRQVLSILTSLWEAYPSMRFGQLLENFICECPLPPARGVPDPRCIYHLSDADMIKKFKEAIKRYPI